MAAARNEVVELLDDSSDDEKIDPELALAKALSLRENKLAIRKRAADDHATIDLCGSSGSSDEDTKQPAAKFPAALKGTNRKRLKPSLFGEEVFSEESDDCTQMPSRNLTRIPKAIVSGKTPPPRESLAKASYYVAKAKIAAEKYRRSSLSQEDNLDDAEILNYSSGQLIQRNTVHQRSAPRQSASTFNGSVDDDDEDALLNYSSGLARSATRPTTASIASTNVVTNPYATSTKLRDFVAAPTSQQAPPFSYPKLSSNSRLYPDERARYLLAFWKYGRNNCSRRSHDRPKLDSMAKRVVRLAVSQYPIRSLEEYVTLGATAVSTNMQHRNTIREELDQGGFDQIATRAESVLPHARHAAYYSIAEACLVTLLAHAETRAAALGCDVELLLQEEEMWVPLTVLIPAIDRILRPECPGRLTCTADEDFGAEYYLQQSTRSMEFLQISKLECSLGKEGGPFIKQRKRKSKVLYELLRAGYEAAVRIRSRQFPAPPGHYRCSKIANVDQVDKRYPNICLGVDLREGGGGAKTLHQMCNKLDMMNCPYFVGSLSIGDYVFFTEKDLLCPIVVERKSVQDVAMSIYDGRWKSQKHRMYVAQFVFGYENCRMVYIIEGNENKQAVSGDYVGARCYDVDKEKLHAEIDNLRQEGFAVLRTTSVENSMFELSRWAQRAAAEIKAGALRAEYTYAEFKEKVAEIPKQTDFSRIAKYHMHQEQLQSAAESKADGGSLEVLSATGNQSSSHSSDVRTSSSLGKPPSKKKWSGRICKDDEFNGWTKLALQDECAAAGLPKTGSREDLVARLEGPRPPKLWVKRRRMKQYVPERHDVAGTALLVALYLHETDVGANDVGLEKSQLYTKAEGLNITKNPFSGGTTQTGPYHYDGWSGMAKLLVGDPALVIKKKNRYKLSRSCDIAGYKIAEAMHAWCHQHNNCPCGELGLEMDAH